MREVELRTSRAAFADALGRMRDWLDRNGRPVVRFETETVDGDIIVKVQFEDDALAERFAQEFDR